LPVELDTIQNIRLVSDYVNQNFVSRGMCADICIHDKGDGNPHAHILLTMRPLEHDGTWGAKSKMEYILDDNGERIKLPSGRYKVKKVTTTDWDSRDNAELWRKNWADTLNKYLEHYGHKNRVDHRSYERQGLEQLPTIHLGVTAHGLEQRGITTERGDINRKIKVANAQLEVLNTEIRTAKQERHDILNPPPPPKPKFIIDLENSIKAKGSPSYANWCRIFNLQQAARSLLYIQENGYTDMQSLQTAYKNAISDTTNIKAQLHEVKGEISSLRKQKQATETYRKTVDTWKKYSNTRWFLKSSKEKFYAENKKDIEDYKAARAYIYDELKQDKFPNLKKLSGEITALTTMQKDLQQALPIAEEKANMLKVTTHNARMLLGYRELELLNITPATMPADPSQTPVYKSSFAVAEKSGALTLEQYFLNMRLNNECAVAVQKAISTAIHSKNAVHDVVEIYGVERVEWVLAAVERDTTDKLSSHKELASQIKLPNEPRAKSALICDENLSVFITQFKDVVRLKNAEALWDSGQERKLSHVDRMAVAKKRANKHNQNRVTVTPSKQKKRNELEMS